jgi:hypothetical protein
LLPSLELNRPFLFGFPPLLPRRILLPLVGLNRPLLFVLPLLPQSRILLQLVGLDRLFRFVLPLLSQQRIFLRPLELDRLLRCLFVHLHLLRFVPPTFVLRFPLLLPFALPHRRLFILPLPFVRSRQLLFVPRQPRFFLVLPVPVDPAFLCGPQRPLQPRLLLDDSYRLAADIAGARAACAEL